MVDLSVKLSTLLEQADEHTLVVIGNGFDIAHGIESSYTNFRDWLIEHNHSYIVNAINTYFPSVEMKPGRWGDVETALGFYNEKKILNECRPDEEFDMDHSLSSAARVTDSVEALFKSELDEFRELFVEWVNSLKIDGVEQILYLKPQAKYLSFNYTETLEMYYGIPSENVLHMHGSRLEHGSEYVCGHFLKKSYDNVWGDEESMIYEIEAHENVVRWMNEWYKPTEDFIMRNFQFFQSLKDVDTVIFIGKVINKVDEDYFTEIHDRVSKDAIFYMTYHYDFEPDEIDAYITSQGLPFGGWKLIKW